MKGIHLIVDYSFLYYKYFFMMQSGRMRKLTTVRNGITVDTSIPYYTLKEIEKIRGEFSATAPVTVSVCFDSKSDRRNENEDYKANRVSRLTQNDFDSMELVAGILRECGYNVLKVEGMEADDLVANLIEQCHSRYGMTVVVTPDLDLAVHISADVCLYRYKSKNGYTIINQSNARSELSNELKCNMPENGLLLFKCMCGDKSDNIKGIGGFGPKSFEKYIDKLKAMGVPLEYLANHEFVEALLSKSTALLGEEGVRQALIAFQLVQYRPVELGNVAKVDSDEKRAKAYGEWDMYSLCMNQ